MAADFSATKTQDVYAFLKKAATSNTFRKELETWSRHRLAVELGKYGVVVADADVKAPPRTLLSKAQCAGLIKTLDLEKSGTFNPYAKTQYDYNPSTLAPLIMVIGYAMPLAAVDSEVAAAG